MLLGREREISDQDAWRQRTRELIQSSNLQDATDADARLAIVKTNVP